MTHPARRRASSAPRARSSLTSGRGLVGRDACGVQLASERRFDDSADLHLSRSGLSVSRSVQADGLSPTAELLASAPSDRDAPRRRRVFGASRRGARSTSSRSRRDSTSPSSSSSRLPAEPRRLQNGRQAIGAPSFRIAVPNGTRTVAARGRARRRRLRLAARARSMQESRGRARRPRTATTPSPAGARSATERVRGRRAGSSRVCTPCVVAAPSRLQPSARPRSIRVDPCPPSAACSIAAQPARARDQHSGDDERSQSASQTTTPFRRTMRPIPSSG